jgi:hypothetical protein
MGPDAIQWELLALCVMVFVIMISGYVRRP